MNKNTSWGNVANWYDGVVNDSESYQSKVILPNLLRIIGAKKGGRILDVACGQGFFSHAFAKEGASVMGVDISKELISIAKKNTKHGETFFVSSADNLSKFKDQSFDTVLCVLAIQNIERITDVFREVGRVIKNKGKFVIVLNHPAFRIAGKTHWGFDENAKVQYRRVDEYMGESKAEIDMNPGKEVKEITYSFHRPLQVYSKNLANSGFAILRIEEWMSHKESEEGPRKSAEDKSRKEIPMFMCLECVKL